ncbi:MULTISPECIES: NAD(P)-dependent oxidoreductase [unclassified Streptomyces]|uniref:NAD-dependent epimerase/dehydratase family protein n=1 Tax=Streptomycetaceae TaxID=2062 RepID=UPI002E75A797|nr:MULTISPECIES: NAD(P)-dependent oxidoreductase [unclassified Streptomyces]MED7951752.1 NAD(P)-dependent oxidoreductase [Streptomyces sp. BE303]MEE1828914.1 NAD(P)-dependent oxidoreductase [Streptomyces sp. BE20]
MTAPHTTPSRVAVLGGTGFIGRVLGARLLEQGVEVVSLARKAPAVPAPGRFVAFDISSDAAADLTALLDRERIDTVVNAAGGMWGLNDEQMYQANVVLVDRLIEAVSAMASPARLVHLGTVHEYGMAPVGTGQRESDPAAPVMEYGKLKLAATEALVRAVEAGRLDAVSLRLGNVVGAGQPGHSLLGVMAAKLDAARLAGETAQLSLQPLTAQRDFVDLTDTLDAVLIAARADVLPPVVNVGTGTASSARLLVELLIEESGVPTEITEVPAPDGTGPETEWQQLDVTVAREQLGWEPRRTLREAVRDLWQAQVASSA